MNIADILRNGMKTLELNNISNPKLDSEILLSVAINKSREYIILNSDLDISNKEYIYYQKMVNQRSKGKPIAYLTEKKFFWKHEFYVNEKVLIPRPETERLIDIALDKIKKIDKPKKIDTKDKKQKEEVQKVAAK